MKIFGKSPFREGEIFDIINYVPANREIHLPLNVTDFLLSFAKLYGMDEIKVDEVIRELNLKGLKKRAVWSLSIGEQACLLPAKSLLN